jgi:chromosomal replication initiation ATPase DnaA
LPLVPPPSSRFANYLGSTNAAPLARLRAYARACLEEPGPRLPILLLGPRGSGKSHLARALAAEVDEGGGRSVYLDLAGSDTETVCALLAAGGWTRYACLSLDGIGKLRGRRPCEEALLSLLVETAARPMGILLTEAEEEAVDGAWLLPDVASRLRSAETLRLLPPDEVERHAVLRACFESRRTPVEESVLNWIDAHAPRDLTTLGTLVALLLHEAARQKRKISIGLSREVLRSMSETGAGGGR